MQIKLKANLTSTPLSDGEDMDIDSDFDDEHSIWQPSKNDERDTISSDEEDVTVTRINFDGIMENYKCNNCSKVYQKSGHLLKEEQKQKEESEEPRTGTWWWWRSPQVSSSAES